MSNVLPESLPLTSGICKVVAIGWPCQNDCSDQYYKDKDNIHTKTGLCAEEDDNNVSAEPRAKGCLTH